MFVCMCVCATCDHAWHGSRMEIRRQLCGASSLLPSHLFRTSRDQAQVIRPGYTSPSPLSWLIRPWYIFSLDFICLQSVQVLKRDTVSDISYDSKKKKRGGGEGRYTQIKPHTYMKVSLWYSVPGIMSIYKFKNIKVLTTSLLFFKFVPLKQFYWF